MLGGEAQAPFLGGKKEVSNYQDSCSVLLDWKLLTQWEL